MKQEMLSEVKQADAIGVDLQKSGGYNNEIIKEILSIYFQILKAASSGKGLSPLLRSVFLGIPQFVQFINIEIVWDLINVLREYIKFELELEGQKHNFSKYTVSNVMAGLLCAFQIIEVGAGTSFNVEEKDFIDALYTIIPRLISQPNNYTQPDVLAFLKCAHLIFVTKRSLSTDVLVAFGKRLAILQVHLPKAEQGGVLMLVKQLMQKYPAVRSSLLDPEEDTYGLADTNLLYRADVNDPCLANASQTHCMFEFLYTHNQHVSSQSSLNFKLARSILFSENLPNECLGLTPLEICKKIQEEG